MHLVRFAAPDGSVRVGVSDGPLVAALAVSTMAELLGLTLPDIRRLVEAGRTESFAAESVRLLVPLDGRTEVWAAGVTYERSRAARSEDQGPLSPYDLVYDAERPELFYKAAAWRVVTTGEPIGIRRDSDNSIPEAELAFVANAFGELVGYVASNDVSSRSIEAINPLYLPQAKVYAGSSALSPGIRPAWEIDGSDLEIALVVERAGEVAESGSARTRQLRRSAEELLSWLFAGEQFPDGVALSTGTGVIPRAVFTLKAGDLVRVDVEGVGTIENPVVEGREPFAFLAAASS